IAAETIRRLPLRTGVPLEDPPQGNVVADTVFRLVGPDGRLDAADPDLMHGAIPAFALLRLRGLRVFWVRLLLFHGPNLLLKGLAHSTTGLAKTLARPTGQGQRQLPAQGEGWQCSCYFEQAKVESSASTLVLSSGIKCVYCGYESRFMPSSHQRDLFEDHCGAPGACHGCAADEGVRTNCGCAACCQRLLGEACLPAVESTGQELSLLATPPRPRTFRQRLLDFPPDPGDTHLSQVNV